MTSESVILKHLCVCAKSLQSCPTLCNPMDCSPPDSSVHRILQARILEWVACPPPGDLPDPGIKLRTLALQADSLPSDSQEKPYHRGLECKSRKSRDTRVTGKFGLGVQNEANQSLTEFCQENALVIANTLFQQHKRRLYTWTPPYG